MSTRRSLPETAQGLVGDLMSSIAGDAAAEAAARRREAQRRETRERRLRIAAATLLLSDAVDELVGNQRYVLSVTIAGQTVSFDSRRDPEAVFREVRDGG